MIVAFEGIDGAGKNTLVSAVEAELIALELPVARLAFPRYEQSIHAQLAAAALHGEMGDLVDSSYGMATMFALDRAEVAEDLQSLSDDGYIVLLDRYVASNAAYSAARAVVADGADGTDGDPQAGTAAIEWVTDLEFNQLGTPQPDLQILVSTPVEVAAQRAQAREADDSSRKRDPYERNNALQLATAVAYERLAAAEWASPWVTLPTGELQHLVATVLEAINEHQSSDLQEPS